MSPDPSHPGGPPGAAACRPPGQRVSKTITREDVDAFARLTGDFNALHVDDTVEATGTVETIDPATRIIEIRTEITNQNGETVLRGRAKVKVLRLPEWGEDKCEARTVPMSELLEGRVALVTGASRGIGRAVARTLAMHGAEVWINYHRSKDAAAALESEVAEAGGVCRLDRRTARVVDRIAPFGWVSPGRR